MYGARGFFRVAGHIDDGPAGTSNLELDVRPISNEGGDAACPASPAPAASVVDSNVAVADDFDVGFASGTWNVGHAVLICFYFHHHDNSVTQTSETVTFRAPIDTIALAVPASVPADDTGAATSLLLSVTGETDSQYAGQVRIQPASIPCGVSAGDTSKRSDTVTTVTRRAAGRVTFSSKRSARPRKRASRAGSATRVRGVHRQLHHKGRWIDRRPWVSTAARCREGDRPADAEQGGCAEAAPAVTN